MKIEKNSSFIDTFIILQLSANDFRVRTKGGNNNITQKLKQVRYINITNIA